MSQTIEAVYDGSVFHPDEPVQMEANTRVRIIVEPLLEKAPKRLLFWIRLALCTSRGFHRISQKTWTTTCTGLTRWKKPNNMNRTFLDTAYAVALSIYTDKHHVKAIRLSYQMEANGTRLITTRGVMMEIGNAMSRTRYRNAAVALLQSLEDDENVEIVPLSEELYAHAFTLYHQRPDKEWGMVDCISFMVMQERGLIDALTNDEHFAQAGFRVLLREP